MSDQNPLPRGERPLPAAWTDNPFKAPAAHVADVRIGGATGLAAEPAAVETGRGTAWWSAGWGLFREATGVWIGITIALLVMTIALSLIPLLGLALYLIFPVFTGGLMQGCRSIENGEGLNFGHLFAGFKSNLGQLAMVGGVYFAGIVAIFIVGFVVGFGGSMAGNFGPAMVIVMLLAVAVSIPLAMAMWFAPALVMLNGMGAIDAMKLSFRGCLRNVMPFLVWGVVGMVLAVLASIPLGLGWLLLMPVIITSTYAAYRDIFLA